MPPKRRNKNTTAANTQPPTNIRRSARTPVTGSAGKQTLTKKTVPQMGQTEENSNTNKGNVHLLYTGVNITEVLTVEKRKRALTTTEPTTGNSSNKSELFSGMHVYLSLRLCIEQLRKNTGGNADTTENHNEPKTRPATEEQNGSETHNATEDHSRSEIHNATEDLNVSENHNVTENRKSPPSEVTVTASSPFYRD